MIKVLTIEGMDSYYPCQAYYKLLFGLSMIPAYAHMSLSEFAGYCELLSDDDKEKIIKEAVQIVTLEPDEILKVVCWAVDPNGVRYSRENLKKATPQFINEILRAVILEVAKAHKIDMISEDEKKNLKISPLTSEKPSQSIPISH